MPFFVSNQIPSPPSFQTELILLAPSLTSWERGETSHCCPALRHAKASPPFSFEGHDSRLLYIYRRDAGVPSRGTGGEERVQMGWTAGLTQRPHTKLQFMWEIWARASTALRLRSARTAFARRLAGSICPERNRRRRRSRRVNKGSRALLYGMQISISMSQNGLYHYNGEREDPQ